MEFFVLLMGDWLSLMLSVVCPTTKVVDLFEC